MAPPLTAAELSLLREHVYGAPLVDGHAHNLVHHRTSSFPFLRAFSEAEDEALLSAPHTLSFKRSVKDIANLYDCGASLEEIGYYRGTHDTEVLSAKCLESSNLSAVLIDDGLELDKMYDLEWHKKIFPNVYRILRIEKLAEDILSEGLDTGVRWTLDSFSARFNSALEELSPLVAGFKSIAAYRGGLNIDPSVSKQDAEEGLQQCLKYGNHVRITDKSFGDFIFLRGLEIATSHGIPIQIHTGFGDRDLDLSFANPLHLCPVLKDERFLNSRIVLLHASYPFFKEASYLASVYSQVYLDFGLAVPKLSVKGMRSAVSGLLELCPVSKVMFSTDGYAFPETFFLGIKWTRETLIHVLSESCVDGDLSFKEALQAASDILGNNAIKLYKLPQKLGNEISKDIGPKLSLNGIDFNGVKYVRLLWSDGSGQRRCRVVPKKKFESVTKAHGVGLAKCVIALPSYADCVPEGSGFTTSGEVHLLPDMTTKRLLPWSMEEELYLVDMHLAPGSPWEYCPRSILKRLSRILLKEFDLVMKAGFEIEFYILKQSINGTLAGFDNSTYCSSTNFDGAASMLLEISNSLHSLGVDVNQLHAESGGGQFELSLQYGPCIKAADELLITRETIKCLIQRHGLVATFLPKFFPQDAGSGSHVHLSLWQGERNVVMGDSGSQFGMSVIGQEFMAGVLHHLPSLLAFVCPMPNSYKRLVPNTWSGAFHCWGRENKEAPLRTSCPPGIQSGVVSNFELKSFDGCANPHLGLAAILAAGMDGLRNHLKLPDPIEANPASLDAGVVSGLPSSLDQSVAALEGNKALQEALGASLVKTIIAIRKSEIEFYKKNEDYLVPLAFRY